MVKANTLLNLKQYLDNYDFSKENKIRFPNLWINTNKKIHGFSNVYEGEVLKDSIALILKNAKEDIDYSSSLNKVHKRNNWLKDSHIYSLFIRPSFSLKVGKDIKNGTFLRAINYLPTLKKMGINLIYLLPIFEHSKEVMKGDLGSPYSTTNFYKLDNDLYDNVCSNNLTIEEQFHAFCEACHILGMRVSIDFVPRTNGRDSSLLEEHPEWFYWIPTSKLETYKTPYVENVGYLVTPHPYHAKDIYSSKDVKDFIKNFTFNPQKINKELFEEVKNMEGNFLRNIEETFGITTAPAFSDVMNDPQPAWSDATYLRLYLDNPFSSKEYTKDIKTPYALFDVAKASLNPGKKENKDLWDYITNVLPYYQEKFGVDCARIDMGHALPNKLNKLLIRNARKVDPYFGFIAEEMNLSNAINHKKFKYNAILGNSFLMIHELNYHKLQEFAYATKYVDLPVFASCETHDTPRVTSRENGVNINRFLSTCCMFLPNAIPFLNCGQELQEIAAINSGLGSNGENDKKISKNNALYGKLPLFDAFYYSFTNPYCKNFIKNYIKSNKIRTKYYRFIKNKDSYMQLDSQQSEFLHFGYFLKDEALIFIANTNQWCWYNYIYNTDYLHSKYGKDMLVSMVYSNRIKNNYKDIYLEDLTFSPLEVKIIHIKKKS